MIGNIFQPMCSSWRQSSANMTPYGKFFTSFKDAFEVVRSLRSQGYRADVKSINPYYSI